MRSSAMRDLMAITERPEVISLAGGLPDTSTFDAALFARLMERIADGRPRALQYGPSEGLRRRARGDRPGDGRGGHARRPPTR